MTGLVKAVVLWVALWDLGLAGVIEMSAGSAAITALAVMAAIEVATACVTRPFVLHHQHPGPGGVPLAVSVAVLPPLIGFLVCLALRIPAGNLMVATLAITVVYGLFFVTLDTPWERGDSDEEIRRKIKETKKMTREHFRPDA